MTTQMTAEKVRWAVQDQCSFIYQVTHPLLVNACSDGICHEFIIIAII